MPKVILRVFGGLATVIGRKEVEAEGSLLKEVLMFSNKDYGEEFKKKIFDSEGNLQRHIRIYVNGKDIRFLKQLNTPLKDGDQILILPAVVGG